MVAIGNKQGFNNVFSRIIFNDSSTSSNNMNASISKYNLIITGIFIKNNDTLLSLFYDDSSRIMIGTVDMANYTFLLK